MPDHSSISPRRTSNGNGARRNSRPLMNSNNASLPLLSLSFQTTTNPFASKQIAQTSQLVQSYPRNHLMANGILLEYTRQILSLGEQPSHYKFDNLIRTGSSVVRAPYRNHGVLGSIPSRFITFNTSM